MDTEKITEELNRRFSRPLPEFYSRRIIFWHDEEREFEDKLDEIELDNAKLVKMTGSNTYAVKKLLCSDDLKSNFLVYTPLEYDRADDDWMLNVELYSEEFRADLVSTWMEEMGFQPSQTVRDQVGKYRKFFDSKERRAKVKSFGQRVTSEAQTCLVVMAVICGNKDPQPGHVLQAVLCAGLDEGSNVAYKGIVGYGAEDAFWGLASEMTGYQGERSLLRLAEHVLLTAASRTMSKGSLSGLESYISEYREARCYDLVSDWQIGEDKDKLYETASVVENELRLRRRFSSLPVDELVNTDVFLCIDECILASVMNEIKDDAVDVEKIRSVCEKRRTCAWYDRVSCYYEGVAQAANMQEFYLKHVGGFHTVEPDKLWKEYTDDYYRMDTYYRLFQLSFQRSLTEPNSFLDDPFKDVVDWAERLYSNWFLGELNDAWSERCSDQLRSRGRIFNIQQQEEFYKNKISRIDSRVYVIISDALRFEVAASLADQLRRETQSEVMLSSQEAVFPTATKYGMAALLPHKRLDAVLRNGTLSVLADGQSTDAGNRDQVLKNAKRESVALNYSDVVRMKRSERAEKVKGMDVVYFYHNRIDESSHTDDVAVFPACDDTIDELKNLARIIVNEFSGSNIIITSDHGFLYTYRPLNEDEKVDRTTESAQDVEVERRYLITKKGSNPGYLLPVKFLGGGTDFEAYAPMGNVRIKKKGGGLNYVHGGISLQEMVVPVIEYHRVRSDSPGYRMNREKIDTKPVEIELVSSVRKISNMLFSLNFYQKDPVCENREGCSYLLYFEDTDGRQVSDVQKIIADKTNPDRQERQFRIRFNLRSQKFDGGAMYYLIIRDESGLQMPKREEFQIDIPFAVDDFNFFG